MELCITVVKLVYEYLLWIKANGDICLSIMRVALRRRYFVYRIASLTIGVECRSATAAQLIRCLTGSQWSQGWKM